MDALTDPMIASQLGRLERRIAELEAENQRLREAARIVCHYLGDQDEGSLYVEVDVDALGRLKALLEGE